MMEKYLELEEKLILKLSDTWYIRNFIYSENKLSGRITLYLLILGIIAFINELYINIEMIFISKSTYEELDKGFIDHSSKLHKLLNSEEYHSREYYDDKQGIIIEEFEERSKFFAKPIGISHLSVECQLKDKNGVELLNKPIKYYIEFLQQEYEEDLEKMGLKLEFGCTLNFLRQQLYHLFKDSDIYEEFFSGDGAKNFSISKSLEIRNRGDEVLDNHLDGVQLCFLKIHDGDTIKCDFLYTKT
ncbi:hypothetical protein TBLA_0B08770 [Henningerozyma blattae CBS 6284]|uniref:Uncharacterized protein n=1 Tax=Henningerozyma blattae (strain ATCC 34711 / CBS 6284 / DSM 70876 / NBRC 10599 / NRRL Y-10934 / UCD 77-7) TaxID=1071380 RepID=I2GZZ1_HENB6|nr:hypothetical protein TBLA_0B08770 [Tetrapisispora blattae CBS 6284]CCH59693.1 hypothetical protein TBLA_0B08770 [Tetrapisispora blattae CBS 6284]